MYVSLPFSDSINSCSVQFQTAEIIVDFCCCAVMGKSWFAGRSKRPLEKNNRG